MNITKNKHFITIDYVFMLSKHVKHCTFIYNMIQTTQKSQLLFKPVPSSLWGEGQ